MSHHTLAHEILEEALKSLMLKWNIFFFGVHA